MTKGKKGFTLVELLIASVLLIIVSLAAYTFLKNSIDSTQRQRMLIKAQEDLRTAVNTIKTEMGTATSPYGTVAQSYTSAVAFPGSRQRDTFGSRLNNSLGTTKATDPLVKVDPEAGNFASFMLNNNNRLLFFIDREITAERREELRLVEYRVALVGANETATCQLERMEYGRSQLDNFLFDLGQMTSTLRVPSTVADRQTIITVPANGSALTLYVGRPLLEENDSMTGQKAIAQDQFVVSIDIFVRMRNPERTTGNLYSSTDNVISYQGGISSEISAALKSGEKKGKRNYHRLSMETIVKTQRPPLQ